ncbi:2-dehydropantoate 2-reductase [Oceanispirochaeta sp.]|uniref:2-dehydropantoate 2-reductase n=1 Tax=Oceanispirochaeta sp. TaxID=2035350 RepID=UPI0026110D2A|nr:2-dehydropantoate 2-reductase [Oceanispirochaeta sp.]MDA3956660.1 2-dehydropantoate 2-reductase [Oceanispirochaeta sp.]
MTFSVYGTGAVGAYYGGRLAERGNTVHFLARSDYRQIKEKGIKVNSPRGDFHLETPSVFQDARRMPPSDVLLISLKTTANKGLREHLMTLVHEKTALVILQNGLGMEEEFQSWFPDNPILGGMCFICARKKEPAVFEHLDYGLITLGTLDKKERPLRDRIGKLMEEAGIPVTLVEDLKEARWRKLLWNIPYNGLSVTLNCNTKAMMENRYSRKIIETLMMEVLEGAATCGCPIGKKAVEKMLHFTEKMTPYEPSMKLDYLSGRPMEIEYMYDRPLQAASDRGCTMKGVSLLRDQLKYIQEQYSKLKPGQ